MEDIKKYDYNKVENRGFIEPVLTPEDYRFKDGQLELKLGQTVPVVRPDHNWQPFLPAFESQLKQFDVYGCTAFGTLNSVEALAKALYDESLNLSDRYLGIRAGTRPPGNDPNKVAQTFRKEGACDDSLLPFADNLASVDEYYSFKGANEADCEASAQKWLDKYVFGHDWIADGRVADPETIWEGLTHSPILVAVYAWAKIGDYYVRNGEDTHWTVIVGGEYKKYFLVYDSYGDNGEYLKKLEWNFGFAYAKRITLINKPAVKKTIFYLIGQALTAIGQLLGLIQKEMPKIEPPKIIDSVPIEDIKPIEKPKYEWDTPEKARHSFRVICDEEGLSVTDKNKLCQVLNCESGFKINAYNDNGKTKDWGICQYNDYWYIGQGKPIASVEEALSNPEKCVRVFISQFKKGRLKDWVCYSSGKYKNYSS